MEVVTLSSRYLFGVSAHADQYHTICANIHRTRYPELSRYLREHVLDPLSKHLSLFPIVKEMVKKRKRKLLDVQSYKRQVLTLAKTGKRNPERFKRKKDKLSQFEAIFNRIDGDLVSVLEDYDKSRELLLLEYTWRIMHAQRTFIRDAYADTGPLKSTSEIFQKSAAGGNTQVEDRLSQMVELFKQGEYASDATQIPVGGEDSGDHSSPVAIRTSPRVKKLSNKTADLQCYLNPPFDINLPFETRHRMWAPSDKDYMWSKDSSDNVLLPPAPAKADRASTIHLRTTILDVVDTDRQDLKTGHREEAVFQYKATETDELSLYPGDIIDVVQRNADGWWIGRLNGVEGIFPCNHTRPMVHG